MPQKSKGMDKKLTTIKHEIAQEVSSAGQGAASGSGQKVFEQNGGRMPGRRGKKILLIFMVAASICVVAAWAVFTVKPSWLAEVKTRLSLTGAPKDKRSPARYPSRPVFKVVQPQRTNPLPPSTPPMMAEQMQRPQTGPSGISPAAPPSAYPVTRPQVSTPGAPGIAPTMPPSSVPRFPGEVQSPPAGTSSGQGATSGFSPSKKEDSESDEYLEIATLYAQKGKYQKAEELFQKVAKENPSSARAHNNLGVVRLKQEKYDMAEREFKEAIRLEPAFVLPYYNLSCLYSKKGVNVEALIYLKKALKRDERVKQWVKTDKDFDRLRSDVVFQELVGAPPPKKEGAQKKEGIQKQEGIQKLEGVEGQRGIQKQETQVQEGTQKQEGAQTTGEQKKKEEIPPQAGPPQQVMPQQETPQGGAQNQEGTKGGAQNQQGAQGGAAQ